MSDKTLIFLQLALVAFCWVAEYFFPRLTSRADSLRRLLSIFIIWLAALAAVAVCQAYLFQTLINWLAPFKVLSLSQLPIPNSVGFVLSLLCIDLFQYFVHWISHKIAPLWAIHSVHHADKHVTAATGLLHHPFEAVFNFITMLCFLILFGVSLQVIVAFSLLSAVHNLLVHANVRIPPRLEHALRWFIVTPDMHRTHHSVNYAEGNSNFGQIFPYWDRLFGTYIARPSKPVAQLRMGLPPTNPARRFDPLGLLSQPFHKNV